MQITIEDISPVEKRVEFEVPWGDVAPRLEKAYTQLRRDVHLKGFRPGKVPRALIEKMYKSQVEQDVATFRRDVSLHRLDAELIAEEDARLDRIATGLARSWPRRKAVRAAIGHALEFETWRSLARRQGLRRDQAVDAMVRLVASV